MAVEIQYPPLALPERGLKDRRKTLRRAEDRMREDALRESIHKLQSILELGHLIGLDLKVEVMLQRIAQKAAEVMGADRCSVFLYDSATDELWSQVALGLEGQVIRVPANTGLVGHCFQRSCATNIQDAYEDPRFNREIDAHTGYRTRSVLCMPMYARSGQSQGVIQLLNKRVGHFTEQDEAFLQAFASHASIFIEIAQLQKARIEALEQSRAELRRLNRAKDKAIHHLSHELKTPLSVIKGTLGAMKRKLPWQASSSDWSEVFARIDKHLNRLFEIQGQADAILQTYANAPQDRPVGPIRISGLVEAILHRTRERAKHRHVRIETEGEKGLQGLAIPQIVEDILQGLLKNAIENTPDEGAVRILWESRGQRVLIKVQDCGVGITTDDQERIFDGLFHTQDDELYSSKGPYDFNAGGKGLDLLRMKTYSERFGLDLSVKSKRCTHLPTNRDLCPGVISDCPHCRGIDDCLNSGGSTFCISIPRLEG